ncbi:MAG TPA: hypothetical protein VIV11_03550 [Kofleriaceae bacterium]
MRFVRMAMLVAAAGLAGCGDGPICPSDVFVVIQTARVVTDADPVTEGVQAQIPIRTSLAEGEEVTLAIVEDDEVTSSSTLAVDAAGNAVFVVDITSATLTLRAAIETPCGSDTDEVTLETTELSSCVIAVAPPPQSNEHYAPALVLTAASDPDPATSAHEATIAVSTRVGWTVELVENDAIVAVAVADGDGIARFARAFSPGDLAVEAFCHDAIDYAESPRAVVHVDTQRPSCAITDPLVGTTITPGRDGDPADGIQLAVTAAVVGDDVEGEPVELTVLAPDGTSTTTPGTNVAANASTATVTLAPSTSPATYEFALLARDHAGNACTAEAEYFAVTDGCDIAIAAPIATVITDANANGVDGSQVDLEIIADPACAGQPVTATCAGSTTAPLPVSGTLTLRTTICAASPCELERACSATIVNAAGRATSDVRTIAFDTQGPSVALELIAPAVGCNVQLTPASDTNPTQAGVQIVARVASPAAAQRRLELRNTDGTATFNAANDVSLTVVRGLNRLFGIALDEHGNTTTTASCNVTLNTP